MLKNIMPAQAFAIRFEDNMEDFAIKAAFHGLLKQISNAYPFMTIEGINVDKRKADKKYDPILELGNIAICKVKKEKRNMICVGASANFDISFEKESDIKIGGICPRIPILNLKTQLMDITRGLADYVAKFHPAQSRVYVSHVSGACAPEPVVYHSNFVKVGDQRVPYGMFDAQAHKNNAFEQLLDLFGGNDLQRKSAKKVTVTEKVTIPGFDPLGMSLLKGFAPKQQSILFNLLG